MTEAIADALTTETADARSELGVGQTVEMSEDDALAAAFDSAQTTNGADRGPDGKFVSSTPATAETTSPGGEEGAGEEQVEAAAPVETPAPAPANWQGLEKVWEGIPAEHREQVKTHFDDLQRRMTDQGRQLAQVRPISDRLSQAVSQYPQFKGMSPDQLAQGAVALAGLQVRLESGPQAALDTVVDIAEKYGVLPQLKAKLEGQQMPEGGQQISNLHGEITALKRQLAAVTDPAQIETQVNRVYEGRAAHDAVNQFAQDPANSFWADVEPHLTTFIPLAREQAPGAPMLDVLKAAYDMAIYAIPDVRAKVVAAAKPALTPDPARAEAAKKAASINVKSSSSGKERQLSEDEAYAAAFERAQSR